MKKGRANVSATLCVRRDGAPAAAPWILRAMNALPIDRIAASSAATSGVEYMDRKEALEAVGLSE